jgi:hypothetical protein
MMQTGFSIAIRGIPAFDNIMKNDTAACCLPSIRFASKWRAPETDK